MNACMAPGIYNDCDTFMQPEMPAWRWSELADSNRFCTLPAGHSGLHRDGGHSWGRMQDLTHAEKLEALGVEDES